MKKSILVLFFAGSAALLLADDLVTKSGVVYKDYALMGASPTGIRVMHSNGVSTVKVSDFPDDLSADKKALIQKFEKDIPAEKKKYLERRKKLAAQRKKQQAAAKAEAARVKKSAAELKKTKDEQKKLNAKIKSSVPAKKENPFKK